MQRLRDFAKTIKRSRSLFYGSIIFVLVILAVLIIPVIRTTSPVAMNYAHILQGPSAAAYFGTDDLGRDVLSRVVYGGRTSLMIGTQVMLLTSIFGLLIGLAAGYFPRLDNPIMRVMDVLMSFPSLLLAIAIMAVMENSPSGVVIALSVVYTPRTARVLRGMVLSVREEVYVEAARAVGVPTWRLLILHILPGIVPELIVQETFLFAYSILGEAGLSFVGVGIQPPTPSWGNILGDARVLIRQAPWMLFFPGGAIMATVLSLNLIGDGLREVLDPKRRGV